MTIEKYLIPYLLIYQKVLITSVMTFYLSGMNMNLIKTPYLLLYITIVEDRRKLKWVFSFSSVQIFFMVLPQRIYFNPFLLM